MRSDLVSIVKYTKMQSNTVYVVVKSTYYLFDEELEVYGAALIEHNQEDFSIIKTYPDLTKQKENALEFVKKCNRMSLSQIHFRNAVEDFLIE